MSSTRLILDEKGVARVLARLAREIVERNGGATGLAMVGIQRRGDSLAHRLVGLIRDIEGTVVPVGSLDINLYRDDFQMRTSQPHPIVRTSDIPFGVEGRTIVLVDDVLFTGRTIRAALEELNDFGRAQRIQLAVLIDRDGRELPVQADYTGEHVPTAAHEIVVVHVKEVDGVDRVFVERIAS